ncbi:hypothetical protein FQZ97_865710 [compost metagenome]
MSRNIELEHILMKAREARDHGYGVLSTGERLAAALVLNRADWLKEMNYTLCEAIDRVGPEWVALLRQAQRILADESEA